MKPKKFSIIFTFAIALMFSLLALPAKAPAAETGTIDFQWINKLTGTLVTGFGTPVDNMAYRQQWKITDGTGVLKAETIFRDNRTLAASATEDIDLAGVVTDSFGATITCTKVKAMLIYGAAANTNNVQVGGAAANAFINWVASATDIIEVPPNGMFFLIAPTSAGYAVTAATGDLLTITNGGGGTPVTYDIIIVCETT